MAIEAQGTRFFWSTSTSRSTVNAIGDIVGFNGPGGSAAVIDITSLLSTAKEKLVGLNDEGQLTLDLNFDRSDTGQSLMMTDRAARNLRRACIKFNDTSTTEAHFLCYCLGFSISGAVDDKVTANAVTEIIGPITWTTA